MEEIQKPLEQLYSVIWFSEQRPCAGSLMRREIHNDAIAIQETSERDRTALRNTPAETKHLFHFLQRRLGANR